MSALEALIHRTIRERGPLDVGAYMQLAMAHPTLGYYATRDPFGREGDFVTAPEISQIFGELLGAAMAQRWLDMGGPSPVMVAEMGPGRGTLMADAWRATRSVSGFHRAARLHLVETSRRLRVLQATRLGGVPVEWHDSLATLPEEAPLLLVANELLDALPVRQFERGLAGWRERLVTLTPGGRLAFATAAGRSPFHATLMQRHAGAPLGGIAELSPAREAVAADIARRLAAHRGMALLIDYGSTRLVGPTLQAVRSHATADPLEAPGEADVSSHVDFGSLAEAAVACGATAWGPLAQGELLLRLGAEARIARLVMNQSPDRAQKLRQGAERLIDPAQMGALFQVLALTDDATPPPGFAATRSSRP
ncbi:MAG TPA: SAM-dependent methyltransferase [Geminicoccaceae bacterium]|nr:SAM-dependent methyltransferase [Geminicoccus sp.]HMU52504.1 SAM-dependent methyltransferase [Geminicoccaceae bacterium]